MEHDLTGKDFVKGPSPLLERLPFFHVSEIHVCWKGTAGDRRVLLLVLGGNGTSDIIYAPDSMTELPKLDRRILIKAAKVVEIEPDDCFFDSDYHDHIFGDYEVLRTPVTVTEPGCPRKACRVEYERRPYKRFVIFVVVGGRKKPAVQIPEMIDVMRRLDDQLLILSAARQILMLR